jgi:hypothetical protein
MATEVQTPTTGAERITSPCPNGVHLIFPGGMLAIKQFNILTNTILKSGIRPTRADGVSAGAYFAILCMMGTHHAVSTLRALDSRIVSSVSGTGVFLFAESVVKHLSDLLTDEDAVYMSGKVFLHARTLLGRRVVFSEFKTKEDVLLALKNASFIPGITYRPSMFSGYFDGCNIPDESYTLPLGKGVPRVSIWHSSTVDAVYRGIVCLFRKKDTLISPGCTFHQLPEIIGGGGDFRVCSRTGILSRIYATSHLSANMEN